MGVFKYINMTAFILSLVIGFIAVYITMPDSRIIYVYPTPENVGLLQYKDKSDTCFSLEQTDVKCPINEKDITKISIQS